MKSIISSSSDENLTERLENFTTRHTAHHVPIALVTSGGTTAPLEHNCVRFLDNFSTGTRGAHAVEEFCKRGYAVIHLKREGSVAPFGRILGTALGCGRGGPTFNSLGVLFDCVAGLDEDCDTSHSGLQDTDEVVEHEGQKTPIAEYTDPWMYSRSDEHEVPTQTRKSFSSRDKTSLVLNPRLINSPLLQSTLRNYNHIKHQGLLLTIDFQTVDDYLYKLQLCSKALHVCGSLALVYLAAAVSDFYIPDEKKAMHKIQSRDYRIRSKVTPTVHDDEGQKNETKDKDEMRIHSDNTLTVTLYPVPKVIPTLRKHWCPNAFVVSFKLETDPLILQQKSVLAMERNDVHLVIGNELATRYEKVFILSRENADLVNPLNDDVLSEGKGTDLPLGYQISEVTAAHGRAIHNHFISASGSSSNVDALEYATIEHVVQKHFYYISRNVNAGAEKSPTSRMLSAAEMTAYQTIEAASLHKQRLNNTQQKLQQERLKARLVELALNVAGSAIGLALSYGIARMLQGRQQGTA